MIQVLRLKSDKGLYRCQNVKIILTPINGEFNGTGIWEKGFTLQSFVESQLVKDIVVFVCCHQYIFFNLHLFKDNLVFFRLLHTQPMSASVFVDSRSSTRFNFKLEIRYKYNEPVEKVSVGAQSPNSASTNAKLNKLSIDWSPS